MNLESISPSDLNQFSNCPYKWKLKKSKALEVEVPNEAMLFGSAIHQCIARFYHVISEHPTPDDIKEKAEETFSDFELKGVKAKTKKVMDNFVDFEIKRLKTWKQYKPTLVEKKLISNLFPDLPEFRCIVDAYWKLDETGIDWKVSMGNFEGDALRQGKINEMLLVKNSYPTKRFMFFSLLTGVNNQAPRVTDGWIYKLASGMVESVRLERYPAIKSGLCAYCEFIINCEFRGRCLWEGM